MSHCPVLEELIEALRSVCRVSAPSPAQRIAFHLLERDRERCVEGLRQLTGRPRWTRIGRLSNSAVPSAESPSNVCNLRFCNGATMQSLLCAVENPA